MAAAGDQPPAPQRVGTLFARGSVDDVLSDEDIAAGVKEALEKLGPRKKVLILPPDITRLMSKSGPMACAAYEYYGDAVTDVMPTLGTHSPMSDAEIAKMYPTIPASLFRVHDWRKDVVQVGVVPAETVEKETGGKIKVPWKATLNKLVHSGGHDLVFNVGQVVPHEALGMANYTKNLFIGVAGAETINLTHHITAVYGVENIMGRADNPGRRLFNTAYDTFCPTLPALFAMTVIGADGKGGMVTRGLFIGDTAECFEQAAKLSLEVNFTLLDKPQRKVVCYLDPEEYHFLWTANKAIYRTRMAVADGGELVVMAPGVHSFGEKEIIDKLIRRHGYVTTPELMAAIDADEELQQNLVAAAHLMLSSSEKRFTITYCPPTDGPITREDIEGVHLQYGDCTEMLQRYDPAMLQPGHNTMEDGEEIFFVPQPAAGLWSARERFDADFAC